MNFNDFTLEEVFKKIKSGEIKIQQKDEEGNTLLHYATLNGHIDLVEELIKRGIDVNVQNKYGIAPLYFASRFPDTQMVELLIEAGANPNIQDEDGETALQNAIENERYNTVKLLIEAGADIKLRDDIKGRTPLHYAALVLNKDIVELLLKHGTDVNAQDKNGETPLHTVIIAYDCLSCGEERAKECYDVAKTLIEHGADVNIQDNEGNTPLHLATEYVHGSLGNVVALLIDSGADIYIENKEGKLPFYGIDPELTKEHFQNGPLKEVIKMILDEKGAEKIKIEHCPYESTYCSVFIFEKLDENTWKKTKWWYCDGMESHDEPENITLDELLSILVETGDIDAGSEWKIIDPATEGNPFDLD